MDKYKIGMDMIARMASLKEPTPEEVQALEDFAAEASQYQIHLGLERNLSMMLVLNTKLDKILAFLNRPLN